MSKSKQFHTSMFGFNKKDMNSFIEKMLREFDDKLREKDIEMNMMKDQQKETKARIDDFISNMGQSPEDKNKNSQLLLQAQEKAEAVLQEVRESILGEREKIQMALDAEKERHAEEIRELRKHLDEKLEAQNLRAIEESRNSSRDDLRDSNRNDLRDSSRDDFSDDISVNSNNYKKEEFQKPFEIEKERLIDERKEEIQKIIEVEKERLLQEKKVELLKAFAAEKERIMDERLEFRRDFEAEKIRLMEERRELQNTIESEKEKLIDIKREFRTLKEGVSSTLRKYDIETI